MTYVTKMDGSLQRFDRQKIVRTCMRMGATADVAESIAGDIERRAYDGMPTRTIIRSVLAHMRRHVPKFNYMIDLREAICRVRPKPDFEMFVAQLLRAYGFKVRSNQIVNGMCVDHEVDAVAEKVAGKSPAKCKRETFYVEVKHHYKSHTYTNLGVFLEVKASFDDLVQGYAAGKNRIPFKGAIVVSNTKLSDHARRYSECAGIMAIAWKTPAEKGLERMIDEKKLYPLTIVRGLSPSDQARLGDAGIVTLKQLLTMDDAVIARTARIPRKTVRELKGKAQEILKK
jgi:hypothetical protein